MDRNWVASTWHASGIESVQPSSARQTIKDQDEKKNTQELMKIESQHSLKQDCEQQPEDESNDALY